MTPRRELVVGGDEVTQVGVARDRLVQAARVGVAAQPFKKNVSSESGLGIGLYHAHRQAAQAGYALSLADNRDGKVCFRLEQTG